MKHAYSLISYFTHNNYTLRCVKAKTSNLARQENFQKNCTFKIFFQQVLFAHATQNKNQIKNQHATFKAQKKNRMKTFFFL